jgi:hypothetical protein
MSLALLIAVIVLVAFAGVAFHYMSMNGQSQSALGAPVRAACASREPSPKAVPPPLVKPVHAQVESFANPSEPSEVPFAAGNAPSNCYPKNQLNATELLPSDPNSKWAQVNPQGAGDIAGKNYLNAGALIGVNTVGQSLRNASWDLRSEPANPQVAVSPWFNSTIEPDVNRRMLEIQ